MADRPEPAEIRWHAFLSHSSRDRQAVARIQRFLERYRLPDGSHLRVYRDETDIAGGELPDQLRSALSHSGCLVVCCSPAAAASRWVEREIDAFRQLAPQRPLVPVLLAGETPANLPPPLRGDELRLSDLRGRLPASLLWGKRRAELVRVLAKVAGIDFRLLLPLDRRRRRRNLLIAAAAVAVGLGAAASIPVEAWDDVTPPRARVFGCDTLDDGIALFDLNEPQAIKNIVSVHRNALGGGSPRAARLADVLPRGRLLPGGVSDAIGQRCRGSRRDWVGEPEPGVCVRLSESEQLGDFADPMGGGQAPWTDVSVGGRSALLERFWSRIDPASWQDYGTRQHPSDGLPVAASGNDLWLGFPASEFSRGGLWHSADAGANWQASQRITDVRSVRQLAIGLVVAGRRDGELGFFVRREGGFERLQAPGKGDQLEVCGELDGQPVLRADRRIYRRTTAPWWRTRIA
ncbi:MAG: toll/interleukin-1 receptor domain-containing protein [Candidatus Accumulibacter sp.]|nr:toll/interleukin-1 receptor domain-containing protein [Accumulibacter sp.]